MKIQKLDNGTLLIPQRIESDGIIGDALLEIKLEHAEYKKFLERYNKEQRLEMNENIKKSMFR